MPRGPGLAAQCLHLAEKISLACRPLSSRSAALGALRMSACRPGAAMSSLVPGLAVHVRLTVLMAAGRIRALAAHGSLPCPGPPGPPGRGPDRPFGNSLAWQTYWRKGKSSLLWPTWLV